MAARDRVERLHPWFVLQLRFADVLASRTGLSLDTAVTFFTNLHRRFGFGRPTVEGRSPEWDGFVSELVTLRTPAERIECTKAFAQERLVGWSGTTNKAFGCFSYEAPRDGIVRIHFAPNDNANGIGPLSRLKCASRVSELTDLFAFIRQEHPADARYVVGGSWLYNLEAYRRLFPAAYIGSLEIHTKPSAMSGGSWWGQFLDRNENVVAERVDRFSGNLPHLDPAALWRVFPMPAMRARADIDVFYEHYGGSS